MSNLDKYIMALTPAILESVLSQLHWKKVDSLRNGRVEQFLSPSEEYVAYVLKDKDFSDYATVMGKTVSSIANSLRMGEEDFMIKAMNPAFDILKWRIAERETTVGNISFDSMVNAIESIKNMLLASCQDISTPSTNHKKKTKENDKRLSECKFGQTEIGSYLFNVLCPLGPYQFEMFPEEGHEDAPYFRKVTTHLVNGIHNIQQQFKQGNPDIVNQKVEAGEYSVNFLSGLKDIYDDFEGVVLTIGAEWNQNVPLRIQVPANAIEIDTGCREQLETVIELHKPKTVIGTKQIYYGKISDVGGEPNIDNRDSINISVAVIDENERLNTIKLNLPNTRQTEVLNAFESGRNIKVEGIVVSSNVRGIKLENSDICMLE